MERYFKKNMKFIVASLVFAVLALISYFVVLGNFSFNDDLYYEIFDYYCSDNEILFLGSSLFLAMMIIIDAIFMFRKKVMPRSTTLVFETLMILLMIFDVYYICGNAGYQSNYGISFSGVAPILNLVIMFYWIQSFSYSDSVVKSKKDNDICYYLVIGLVLILVTYYGVDVVYSNLNSEIASETLPFLVSFGCYIVTMGIAYIFFAKAIENYQDELILTAESQKEVRVEAGKKAAKTRKANEDKISTTKKTTTTKKTATKKSTSKKSK